LPRCRAFDQRLRGPGGGLRCDVPQHLAAQPVGIEFSTGLAVYFTFKVFEIVLGISPDFRRPASFIATDAGAVSIPATGAEAGRHPRGRGRRTGYSVALSGDGNAAIVGGLTDNPSNYSGSGAAWVFTRKGNVGASKAASWSAQARWETRPKGHPWRCPPTATPPSSAGGATTARRIG
jgi:hypothetical protein